MSTESGPHLPCRIRLNLLASHYRCLASGAENPGVAQELSLIAQSFENHIAALTLGDAEEAF